jgi:replicative DNA helicase
MSVEQAKHDPWDVELEQAILGSLLVDNGLIDVAAAELTPEDFYDPLHARMFEFVSYLQSEGTVTPLILASVMKTDPGMVEVGGAGYLAGLAAAAPALPNIRAHARLLKELAARRTLIKIGEDLVTAAYDSPRENPAQAITDGATEALLRVGQQGARPIVSAYDTAMESLSEAEKIASGQPVPLVKTGFDKLDGEIGGLAAGDFLVIPAKSGMGKSALITAMALRAARAGVPAILFSLEMTRRQIVNRMVCDIDFDTAAKPMWYSRIRNGRLTEAEFSRFGAAAAELHGLPLEIHDDDTLTLAQICGRARAFAARHKGKMILVLVDYIQIINPGEYRKEVTREQVVNGFARGLKGLAKRLGSPVAAGSQMNENAEGRAKDERRPQGGDVRESKGIFNEADLMISPWRPAYFVENRKPDATAGATVWETWKTEHAACAHILELLGLKNREGRRFNVEIWCEIGSNALRDEQPRRASTDAEKAQADLLETR